MSTKVYGTVGPSCHEKEVLIQLFEKGMTGIRINLSHVNLVEVTEWIENIKAAYEETTSPSIASAPVTLSSDKTADGGQSRKSEHPAKMTKVIIIDNIFFIINAAE